MQPEKSRAQLPQVWNQTALVPVQAPVEFHPNDAGFSLKHYLAVLARRRKLVAGTALVVLAVAMLEVFTATPLYRSVSTVQINPEGAKVLPYEDVSEIKVAGRASDQYIATQARNLSSRTLAGRVIERLGLISNEEFTEPASRGLLTDQLARIKRTVANTGTEAQESSQVRTKRMVDRLLDQLQVRGISSTRLVEVSFVSPDPGLSADVVNTLIEEFIEQRFESRYASASRAADFLEKQLGGVKDKLEISEQALVEYAREHDIVNLGGDDTINRQRLADMSSELTRVESQLNADRASYQAIQDATVDDFPQHLKDASILSLEGRLSILRQKLASLSERHGPMWPEVRQSRNEIAELDQQLTMEKLKVLTSVREAYTTKLAQRRNLLAELEGQRGRVDNLDAALIQYNILKREVDTSRELYDGLLQRLKEAGVSASLRANNIDVIDVGEVSRRPSAPDKPFALVVASLLGLMIGVLAAVLVERADQSLKSAEEATQYLGIPSLGVVPDIAPAGRGLAWLGWLIPALKRPVDESPLVAFGNLGTASTPAAEEFRAIRTALLLSNPDKKLSSILVSSTLDNEGKSTTALNLAIALAKNGNRTLLVDLDLRRSQLSGFFDARDRAGLSTHLAGNTDLSPEVIETPFSDLFFLPAGPPPPNPAELVGAQRMDTAMQLLTGLFDSVVFDTPPALGVSDAYILARKVDGVVLVAQAGRTRRSLVQTVVRRFLVVGANVVGTVLNRVKGAAKTYGYGYGDYGAYYKPAPASDLDRPSTAEKSA